MAVLTLPTTPAPRSATPRLISARADLTPAFGGPVQRIARMGSRWAFDFVLPPMTYATALDWEGLLAETDTALMAVPQPNLDVGSPGSLVRPSAAGQSGSSLTVDGLPAGYAAVKGQWFSIHFGGQRYLHRLTADATADGAGAATLAIRPMLRVSPSTSAPIEFDPPYIEGFVSMPDGALEVSVDRLVHGVAFTITERA